MVACLTAVHEIPPCNSQLCVCHKIITMMMTMMMTVMCDGEGEGEGDDGDDTPVAKGGWTSRMPPPPPTSAKRSLFRRLF